MQKSMKSGFEGLRILNIVVAFMPRTSACKTRGMQGKKIVIDR